LSEKYASIEELPQKAIVGSTSIYWRLSANDKLAGIENEVDLTKIKCVIFN